MKPRLLTAVLAAPILIGCATLSFAQSSGNPPQLGLQEQPPSGLPPAAVPEAAPATAREESPGLFKEVGKLFDKILPLKQAGDAEAARPAESSSGTAPDTLKATGETLSRLTKPSTLVSGRSACPISANGTPDCQTGAAKLCQSKGYKEGKSLNTDAAESCSAKVLIPGRARKPGDCRTDTYVTSALCQ